ncbi:hypothetical protein DNU06_13995 [Putridiphycobacter roseus]|uniref:Ig-like domain-containing protein n=1 Tax=Putridiphycobacter roseus TaxID=2219161 RepID=A0A2W1NDU0_9FLAO|nr:gliding motility-associated C-terminal domain-containing protein [Putridiphycobacter roseus]PZE16236.1 hypothetical protein DNU06_13995 [Putridiphycobacter roseus]
MKQFIFIVTLLLAKLSFASDLTISTSITSPVSGCNLTNAEIVKITIINAATSPYSGTFDVSYTLNAVTTTESITVPILATSTTYIYEFNTLVDLSACAIHDFTFVVSDINDTNPSNDTVTASITNDCTPTPGTFTGATNVCIGMNNGALDLVGNSGQILDWENSIDNGTNWNSLTNNSTSQSYNNITSNTNYRVIFNGFHGICPNDTVYHLLEIDSISHAGILENDSIHCDTIFPTVIHLNNYTGDNIQWYLSLNNGTSYTNYVNPYDTLSYYEITPNFQFFASVKNGTCPADSSNVIHISYIEQSNAGVIQGVDSICKDEPFHTLTVNGSNGNLLNWQLSTDGTNWTTLTGNTNPFQTNIPNTSANYRAIFQAGDCPQDTSMFQITILDSSNAGILVGANSFCDTINNGLIYVDNFTGDIISWVSSMNNGATFNSIPNVNDTLFYANIKETTGFAVVVQNENCAPDTSALLTIQIIQNLTAGTIVAPDSVCYLSDSLDIFLQGYSDANFWWEISLDSGLTWSNTSQFTPFYTYNTTNQTTNFRVINSEIGCENDTTNHVIHIYKHPTLSSSTDTITLGNSISLLADPGFSYHWTPNIYLNSPSIYNPIATPETSTDYLVEITGPGNCIFTNNFHVIVAVDLSIIVVHNIVTPNGDGFNDTWQIEEIEFFDQNEVKVFNQYGQMVYQASPYLNNWNTDNLPNGTYFYTLKLAKNQPVIKGTFTIIDQQ